MADEVKGLLAEVQLESFYVKLRDNLHVTMIHHFDDVKPQDLVKIGMSKPAIRRLKKALQERKAVAKPGFQKFLTIDHRETSHQEIAAKSSLACLILESDLILDEKIGDGSFGVVKKALWKKTGQNVAVKVLKRDLITSDQILEDFIREVNVMHCLDHPNLVKLHGVCLGPQHMMVTELAPYGALLDYLHVNHAKLLLTTLHSYASQLACAMAYLESKSYIHRDIALRNIFLLTPEHIKLGDFGLARILPRDSNVYIMAPDRKVPYAWCAPESLKRREFTHAADAWMYAVTLWELYTFGQEPWMGFNGAEILYKIDTLNERLTRPECCPTQIFQMMLQCWLPEPDDRPTFAAVKDYLTEAYPPEMRAKDSFCEGNDNRKLRLEVDDKVLIVDGRSDKRWWYGQNKRTMAFGYFPRPVLDPLRPLTAADISKPLPSTFVHLGAESGVDNPAQMPDQIYVDAPSLTLSRLASQDETKLNPTYLPCRKQILSGMKFKPPTPQPSISNSNGRGSQCPPLQNGVAARPQSEIVGTHNNISYASKPINPFMVDVFMPELFAVPGPSVTATSNTSTASTNTNSKTLANTSRQSTAVAFPTVHSQNTNGVVSQSRAIPQQQQPSGLSGVLNGQSPSLIDRSTAHYDYLPQPLMPSPDKRISVIGDNRKAFEDNQIASAAATTAFTSSNDPFFVGQAVRDVVAGLSTPRTTQLYEGVGKVDNLINESRSRRSAPVDGQLPFMVQSVGSMQQLQPVLAAPAAAYSSAGDLATQQRLSSNTNFVTMHSQLSNIFGTMRTSQSSSGLSTVATQPKPQQQQLVPIAPMLISTPALSASPVVVPAPPPSPQSVFGSGMIVRLPPPESSGRNGSRKISPPQPTPQTSSATARASPVEQMNTANKNAPLATVVQQTNSKPPPSNLRHENVVAISAHPSGSQHQQIPPVAIPITAQAIVHKSAQPAAPLLPGNYRTAKFLEMASLSPTRQPQTSQSNSTQGGKLTSKYTKTEDILPQLRSTLELAQARRQQAEDADKPQKLRQLLALGLASEDVCRQLLVKHSWNIEAAGSELAERACGRR